MDNIIDYTGSDLIFLVGAPGSRWSGIYRTLSESPDINDTDKSPQRVYNFPTSGDPKLVEKQPAVGQHSGAYWGPYNDVGERFDNLHNCSKEYIYNELSKAFINFNGKKIVKSHFFAYNLDYLAYMFPEATFLLCYKNDIICFSWWHTCGGWGINYPNYTWYKNDSNMLDKIKEENYNILKFAIDKEQTFKTYTVLELFNILNLEPDGKESTYNNKLPCKIAICRGSKTSDINYVNSLN